MCKVKIPTEINGNIGSKWVKCMKFSDDFLERRTITENERDSISMKYFNNSYLH